MKPTEDIKLQDRLTQMFNTAEATWEWSSSKKVADERQRVFIRHLLTVLGEWGYRKQYTCLRCGHSWYPRSPKKPQFCPGCNSPYWDEMRKMPVSESCPAAKKEESK